MGKPLNLAARSSMIIRKKSVIVEDVQGELTSLDTTADNVSPRVSMFQIPSRPTVLRKSSILTSTNPRMTRFGQK
jgi:hypothetical protein